MEATYVGLDVHKELIVATALEADGHVRRRATFPAKKKDLLDYLAALPGSKRVALEACAMWEHVYDAALEAADEVVLANPWKTRLIAEASLKSDKVDSHALAELLRLNGLPRAFAPNEDIRALRRLVRERRYYLSQHRSIQNHVYGALMRRGIPYAPGTLKVEYKREALRVRAPLPEVERGIEALENLEHLVKDLDHAVHAAFLASKEAQLLYSIPGVGELTAVALVAELCPIDRFPNIEKVSSYAGLVPTNHQSAGRSYQGRLKRDCNHFLQSTLVEAAWCHRRYAKKSDVTRKGKRVARRRGKGKGSIAAAHQLLKVVYAVLRRGTPYTPERPSRGSLPAEPLRGAAVSD